MKGYTKSRFTEENLLKPGIKLIGAKTNVRDYLYQFFPPHEIYKELFLGSGTVLTGKKPSTIEIATDVNPYAINYFKMLQDRPEELWVSISTAIRQYEPFRFSENGLEAFNSFKYSITRTDCPILRATYFYLIAKSCFNGIWRLNGSGDCNSPYCKQSHNRGWFTEKWYSALVDRVKDVSFGCEDYKGRLRRAEHNSIKTFIFLDPPYEFKSKELPNGTVTTYNGIKFTRKDFEEMQKLLSKSQANWLMTVSDTPLMRELFKENYIEPWLVHYSASPKAKSRGKKPELLIANYDIISIAEGLKSKVDGKEETQNSSKEST